VVVVVVVLVWWDHALPAIFFVEGGLLIFYDKYVKDDAIRMENR
jgi:hypothetical protein